MSSKGNLRKGAEIVDPIETGLMDRRIIPCHEQIDRIRIPRTERIRKRTANPGSSSRRTEWISIADLIKGDIALNELCQLESIT